jgi:hypothetical protein
MKVKEPVHQRIDYLSKILGVIFVAFGIDRLRSGNTTAAINLILLGALLSISPMFIEVKNT